MFKLSSPNHRLFSPLLLAALLLLTAFGNAYAQSTAFTYQGRLTDQGAPANGQYDLQFTLFDATGAQQSAPLIIEDVQATGGVFTVQLDFGNLFDGSVRLLEIGVRPGASTAAFTTLAPRQPITSTPYAIRSLTAATADTATNSAQLGGVAAGNYVQTNDARLTDARPPAPGSSNYIQNTTAQQSNTNFNISGDGTLGGTLSATTINAATQYNLGGSRVLSAASAADNLFVGLSAGQANTTGNANAFFGDEAGRSNTTGHQNSFFGALAGAANTTGLLNSFFGNVAGWNNTEGSQNAFFATQAGAANTTGNDNSFFGYVAGANNRTGINNTAVGSYAGFTNIVGNNNAFFGYLAGSCNAFGVNNTMIGASTNAYCPLIHGGLVNVTAIGANAAVTQDNSLVLGSINGVNGATADTSVGVGTTAPKAKLHVQGGNILVGSPGQGIILKSPNGQTCKLMTIDNAGAMVLANVACP